MIEIRRLRAETTAEKKTNRRRRRGARENDLAEQTDRVIDLCVRLESIRGGRACEPIGRCFYLFITDDGSYASSREHCTRRTREHSVIE